MKYLLIKSIDSFEGTFNEYELINIEKYDEKEPKWYLGGIKNATDKIYTHLRKGGLIPSTYKHDLAKKIKLLVDGKWATRTIHQYSTFEITCKRSDAFKEEKFDWKLYDYQLILIGNHGSDFDISGIVNPKIYSKLKSLKDSISRVTNIKYNSVCIKMNDEKTYYITADKMNEYISISDFLSWRGVRTIDSVLSLNQLVHDNCVGVLFKIPGASYKLSKGNMSSISDKTFVYESKFNKRYTFDISGNKTVALHEEETGNLYNIPDNDFNYMLELA